MGYRSEVAFCLRVKNPDEFKALMIIKDDSVLNQMLENMVLVDGEFHFYGNSWKWYGDCDRTFHELLSMAEDYDEDFACKFSRIGEESDDVVEEAHGNDGWDLEYPYTIRSLELGCDFDNHPKLKES